MLVLWGRASAYNVQKALWLLAELGLEFRHEDLGGNPGELDSEAFLALNPHARIPVLDDDGDIVWESNTILRYLASKYAGDELWPRDPLERSRVERWMDWELASLQPAFISLFWNYYRTPEAQRDDALIDQARRSCQRFLRQLDRQLDAGDFLAGRHFSLADIVCGVCLFRYFNMGLELEKPRAVMAWYDRLSERAAYKKIIMTPFEQLWGRLEF